MYLKKALDWKIHFFNHLWEVLYIYSICRPHETRVSIGKMRRVPLWESSERSMSLIVTECLIHYERVNNYV